MHDISISKYQAQVRHRWRQLKATDAKNTDIHPRGKDRVRLEFMVTVGFYCNIMVTSQWAPWLLKSPASRLFAQPFVQAHIIENTIARCPFGDVIIICCQTDFIWFVPNRPTYIWNICHGPKMPHTFEIFRQGWQDMLIMLVNTAAVGPCKHNEPGYPELRYWPSSMGIGMPHKLAQSPLSLWYEQVITHKKRDMITHPCPNV